MFGSPSSNSSILVQWNAPEEEHWNGPLRGYVIRYKPQGYPDSTLEHANVTNSNVNTYKLNQLIVFQEYEISVAAYNEKGVGVYSQYVRTRTQEGRPTAPPVNVEAQPVNSTAIQLTWNPPDPQYINGINQGYVIEATRNHENTPEKVIRIPSDTSNMLGKQKGYITQLKKFTDYKISLSCFTSKGQGPKTEPITIKTLEDGNCNDIVAY